MKLHDTFRSASFYRARLARNHPQAEGIADAAELEYMKLGMICASGFTRKVDFPRTYARWDEAVRALGLASARKALIQCAISFVDLNAPGLDRHATKIQVKLICNAVFSHASQPTIGMATTDA